MAIEHTPQTVTKTIKREIAATNLNLGRFVEMVEGVPTPRYPVTIDYGFVDYLLDENGVKVGVEAAGSLGSVSVPPDRVMDIWLTPVTLADGTQTVLAELISAKTDAEIAFHLEQQAQ